MKATAVDVLLALVCVEAITLITWAADSRAGSSATQAVRVGASIWLASLHTRVHAGAAVIGIPPLGLTLICVALVARSAAALAREVGERTDAENGIADRTDLLRIGVLFSLCYGLFAAAIAAVTDTQALHPTPATALVGGLAVGGLGALWGLLRCRTKAGLDTVRSRLPQPARTTLAAAMASLAAMAAVATVVPIVVLVAHHKLAADLAGTLVPGRVGTVSLTVLQLLLAPLLVVGAFSWLAGPGFAVGAGTSVTPWHTTLGPVPALPLLAALPNGTGHVGAVVLVVPALCGVLAGAVILRRDGAPEWWHPFLLCLGTSLAAGLITATLTYAAGGPAGPGRLETVGASGLHVGLAFAAEVLLGSWLAVLAHLAWQTREDSLATLRTGVGAATHSGASGVRIVSGRGAAGLRSATHGAAGTLRSATAGASGGLRSATHGAAGGLRGAAGKLPRRHPAPPTIAPEPPSTEPPSSAPEPPPTVPEPPSSASEPRPTVPEPPTAV